MMSTAFLCALLCHILFLIVVGTSATPSHGDVYLSCSGQDYTSKGTVFVYNATLGSKGGYVNICKENFNRGAAAAVCRQLGYVDADIAEPGHDDTPPKYFTDAYALRCAVTRGVVTQTFMSSANCPRVGDYVRSGQLHIMRCLVGPVQTATCTPVAVKCKLEKLNESDQYRYNGLVWRSAEPDPDGYHTVNLYYNETSKPLCCIVLNYNDNGIMSVPMSTTICRQLGYTTGKGDCIDNNPPYRDGYLPDGDPECGIHPNGHCLLANLSLSCFTDYMSQVTITDNECSRGVAVVQCSFDPSDKELMSAGSRGDCMIEGSEAPVPSPYYGTTIGFGAAFLVTLLILIMVVVVCSTCLCKYKCNRGNAGERDVLINRQD